MAFFSAIKKLTTVRTELEQNLILATGVVIQNTIHFDDTLWLVKINYVSGRKRLAEYFGFFLWLQEAGSFPVLERRGI